MTSSLTSETELQELDELRNWAAGQFAAETETETLSTQEAA